MRPASEDWLNIQLTLEPVVHLVPGPYVARSVALERGTAWGRPTLTARFDVFRDDTLSALAGRLPMFCTLPHGRHRVTPRSKLGHWMVVAGLRPRKGVLPLDALCFRLWRVQVGTVARDFERHPFPASEAYSVVRRVLEAFS